MPQALDALPSGKEKGVDRRVVRALIQTHLTDTMRYPVAKAKHKMMTANPISTSAATETDAPLSQRGFARERASSTRPQ